MIMSRATQMPDEVSKTANVHSAELAATRRDQTMAYGSRIEKFAATELATLRDELMQSGLDYWQAAEVLSVFLVTRGYGVNSQQARDAVLRMDGGTCSYECMQVELERVALVM
jgi:hypothetical protein